MGEIKAENYDCREYFQYKTLVSIDKMILDKGRKKQGEIAAQLAKFWYQKAMKLGNNEIFDSFYNKSTINILVQQCKNNKANSQSGAKLRSNYFKVIENKIQKDEIQNIYFSDIQLADEAEEKYDVSINKDGAAELWVKRTKIGYDLYIGGDGGIQAPEYSNHLFNGYRNVKKIVFGENFDTKNVQNMSWMFYGCERLQELDISSFNTRNVRDMSGMFCGCKQLQELDISNFDTGNVQDMSGMFCGCEWLRELDVSSFNTKNVQDMSCMFYGCDQLQELDISNFDTGNVQDISLMFWECRYLENFQGIEQLKEKGILI